MRESIRARRRLLNVDSPALSFARQFGFKERRLHLIVHLDGTSPSSERGGTSYSAQVEFDSNSREWMKVRVVRRNRRQARFTSFNSHGAERDDLDLGRCDVAALPQWIEQAAVRFKLKWEPIFVADLPAGTKAKFLKWLLPMKSRATSRPKISA